ncbi:MAG: TonB-dependent receptor [Prolixibacteraceae bacterium]|nr:TonB-dependent receptor [Prolixibacteraceae bacterium]
MKLIILFMLLVCGTVVAFGQQTGRLTGVIKEKGDGTIAGANILLKPGNFGAVSDEDGRFRVNNIMSGSYTAEVSFIGYKTFSTQISINPNATEELEVNLEEESITLGDMNVTAQKRSESQKEVPIALTNISANFLESNVIETMGSMSEFVPGVQVQEQTVIFPGFVIRGLTSDNTTLNFDNRVSIFQDGVSISKPVGAFTEFFDIDRVEVLKGPQGTLFGRSAQIGAIHMVTKRAKNETSGNFTLGTGNYNQMRANGYINLPIIENKLFVRVAGIYNKRDGYIENLSGGTLMGKNTYAARASLKYLPGKNSALDLIINYQDDKMPGVDFKSGTFAPKGGDTSPYTFVDMEAGEDLMDTRDVWGLTFQYKQFFSDALSLTAITGYRSVNATSVFDSDGTKAMALAFDASVNYSQLSQELRLNYDGKRFSGFAGANFFHEEGNLSYILTQDERSVFAMISPKLAPYKIPYIPMIVNGEPNLSVTVNPLTKKTLKTFHTETMNENGVDNDAFDIFADGTFKLTQKLKITAGGRLIFENQTTIYRVDPAASPGSFGFLLGNGSNNLFRPTAGRLVISKPFSDWVGRLVMQYDFSKEVSAYASLSKGRRPNVVEVSATDTTYLKAELVYNYEVGFKSLLMDNRLQFNVSGFVYDYRHFQTLTNTLESGGLYKTSYAGEATGKGLETEFQFAATKKLTLFANYAYLDATFDNKDADGSEQKLAGNTFRQTPKHSGAAGLTYQFGLGKAGFLAWSLSASYKSEYFFDDENTPELFQDGYAMLNSAVQYSSINGKYGLRLNMNNITNQKYLIDAGNTGQAFGISTFVPGAPRFWGVQLFYNL